MFTMYVGTYIAIIVFQIVILMKCTRSNCICSNAMINTDNAINMN